MPTATDQTPITEEERQELIARYQRLHDDAVDLQHQLEGRGQVKWGRIALLGLVLVAIGAGLWWATQSVLWAVVGTVVGVPVVVFAGVVVVAFVQEQQGKAARARTEPLGKVTLRHDPTTKRIAVESTVDPSLQVAVMAALYDWQVTRWGTKWSPADHGGRLPAQLGTLLAGGDASWTSVPTFEEKRGEAVDLTCHIGRLDGRVIVITNSETFGGPDKGAICTAAFPAFVAETLARPDVDQAALRRTLQAQTAFFAAKGSAARPGASLAAL